MQKGNIGWPKTLDEALEYVFVIPPGMWENDASEALDNWWAVGTDDHSIIAYACNEELACQLRLTLINLFLNGSELLEWL